MFNRIPDEEDELSDFIERCDEPATGQGWLREHPESPSSFCDKHSSNLETSDVRIPAPPGNTCDRLIPKS